MTVDALADGSAGGGNVTAEWSGTLTVGINNGSGTFRGVTSGAGVSLIKKGTGKQTPSGNNTCTGDTTVEAGTLSIDGSVDLEDTSERGKPRTG